MQTKSVNVNVPSDILNNLGYLAGFGTTIVGIMSLGTVIAKSKSPFIKAGYTIAMGIAGSGFILLILLRINV